MITQVQIVKTRHFWVLHEASPRLFFVHNSTMFVTKVFSALYEMMLTFVQPYIHSDIVVLSIWCRYMLVLIFWLTCHLQPYVVIICLQEPCLNIANQREGLLQKVEWFIQSFTCGRFAQQLVVIHVLPRVHILIIWVLLEEFRIIGSYKQILGEIKQVGAYE